MNDTPKMNELYTPNPLLSNTEHSSVLKQSRRRFKQSKKIAILVVAVISVALIGLYSLVGSHADPTTKQWLSADDALATGAVKKDKTIVKVEMLYDKSTQPLVTISNATVYSRGHTQAQKPGDYHLQLVDKAGVILGSSTSFSVVRPDEPIPKPGQVGSKPAPDPSQSDFSVSMAWSEQADTIRVVDAAGTVLSTETAVGLKHVTVTPSFKTFGLPPSAQGKKPTAVTKALSTPHAYADSGTNNGLLDITVIGSDYTDLNAFHNDVTRNMNGLLSYEPYKSNTSKISFHYVDNTANLGCAYSERLITCNQSLVSQQVAAAGAPQEVVMVVVNNPAYGGAAYGGNSNYGNMATTYNGYDYGTAVFTHEASHIIGALWDEYNYDATAGPLTNIDSFNCYEGAPPAAAWANIVGSADYGSGCRYPNWYRSSQCSLMIQINCYYLNAISQQFINSGISYLTATVDTTPPTAPANLAKSSVAGTSVVFNWSPSTDNVGVTGYYIYRNGLYVQNLISNPTQYNDQTVTPGSTYSYTVKAYDAAGNVSPDSNVLTLTTPVNDTTPPTISVLTPVIGATVSGTTTVSVRATDNVAVSKVEYYINNVLTGSQSGATADFKWNTATLPNGVVGLVARAYDTNYNLVSSGIINVTINNVAADAIAPTVSLTAPKANATVSGTSVAVNVSASDNSGKVSRTELYVDGVYLGQNLISPYGFVWDSTTIAKGAHTLLVKAFDPSNNVGSSSVVVNTSGATATTAPVVTILSPLNGAIVSGKLSIQASASDPNGIGNMTFTIDNGVVSTCSSSSNCTFIWNSNQAGAGNHVITVKATDALYPSLVGTTTITVKR